VVVGFAGGVEKVRKIIRHRLTYTEGSWDGSLLACTLSEYWKTAELVT